MFEKSSKSPEHDTRHGDENPSTGAAGGFLVVSNQPAVLAKPTEGALDHPASWQDSKSRNIVAAAHYLDVHLRTALLDPLGKLRAAESAVRPELSQPRVRLEDRFEQDFGSLAFRGIRRSEHHIENQPQGVYTEETLAALGFLGRIVGDLPAVGIGAHGLAVDDRRRGSAALALSRSRHRSQSLVEQLQCAIQSPSAKMVINRFPSRKVHWQQPPGATALYHVENGVENLAQGGAWTPKAGCRRQQRLDKKPLSIAQRSVVTGIFASPELPFGEDWSTSPCANVKLLLILSSTFFLRQIKTINL